MMTGKWPWIRADLKIPNLDASKFSTLNTSVLRSQRSKRYSDGLFHKGESLYFDLNEARGTPTVYFTKVADVAMVRWKSLLGKLQCQAIREAAA
ncbi:hypothetical protein J1N35_028317 [Gossypium stocksii]|uniref:Uncharacterized protein n=1 Tax=Gossypium stocksii TaxID=47602 RepID=A0A9D3UVU9_9ROSI|nr:hypothetical protein J1N35_028317 [Gossypium stocksii]